MKRTNRNTGPAIVLLHNIDPSWTSAETAAVMDGVDQLIKELKAEGHRVFEAPVSDVDLASALAPFDPDSHIVFNWCEELPGIHSSEFRVAMLLEQLGYTYTGSPPETLSLSWDKASVKTMLSEQGIPTPNFQVIEALPIKGWHRFPAIVKPAFEHCSMGMDSNSVILDEGVLQRQAEHVMKRFDQPVLVEDFIDGREFHVTLWGNSRVNMLPPAEMDFSAFSDIRDRLCTFDSKFTPGSRHYEEIEIIIPAQMKKAELSALRETSIAAYQWLGCRDYARIDLRLRDDIFYVLDVNPNADISPDTSLAYAAEASGIGYGAFISRLIHLAAARHPPGKAAVEANS
ncbi:MAG: ATP-grasp domain-containing protein [Deltaproteobacteria bacterium]|nr:ATP-grasp domain-containing protein [Deltaproteobacteria bacterium]